MGLFGWFKKKKKEDEFLDTKFRFSEPFTDEGSNVILSQTDSLERELADFGVSERDLINKGFDGVTTVGTPGEPTLRLKAILSNKTLTVFLPGGDVIMNTNADKEMFLAVKSAVTEVEVRSIMLDKTLLPEDKKLVDKVFDDSKIMEAIPDFLETQEFNYQNGSLYLNGISLPIPKLLAKEFIKAGEFEADSYYQSLKNFWCWCALNPDNVAREDLFGFLERGDFKITKNGFFLGFRNVVKVKGEDKNDDALVKFITDKYMNIKLKQKKSPKNFTVVELEGELGTIKTEGIPGLSVDTYVIGNLADLYNSLSEMEENVYTDAHTRKMKIVIGKAVSMEREKCDADPDSSCSSGLHIKSKSFGHGESFGDTSIIVAVNPMNVVAVPTYNPNKMRVCEYFPLAIISNNWNTFLDDADTLSLEDEYMTDEIKLLQGTIDSPSSLSTQVFNKLSEYQKVVNQRVVEVK